MRWMTWRATFACPRFAIVPQPNRSATEVPLKKRTHLPPPARAADRLTEIEHQNRLLLHNLSRIAERKARGSFRTPTRPTFHLLHLLLLLRAYV
jgi:hypothetical protein